MTPTRIPKERKLTLSEGAATLYVEDVRSIAELAESIGGEPPTFRARDRHGDDYGAEDVDDLKSLEGPLRRLRIRSRFTFDLELRRGYFFDTSIYISESLSYEKRRAAVEELNVLLRKRRTRPWWLHRPVVACAGVAILWVLGLAVRSALSSAAGDIIFIAEVVLSLTWLPFTYLTYGVKVMTTERPIKTGWTRSDYLGLGIIVLTALLVILAVVALLIHK